MAQTYYYCDGTTKKSTSVSISESPLKYRTYTIGDNTEVNETYKDLTFTFSPTVSFSSGALLKIKYNYQFRTSTNGVTFTPWNSTYTFVSVPSGTTTKTIEVLYSREECEGTDGGPF